MDVENAVTHEQQMESYAHRSAQALETIQSGLMLLLALAIIGLLIGAGGLLAG